MVRKKILNEVEKGQIDVLKKNGLSNRAIARQIKRSEKVIRNYLKLGDQYGAGITKSKRNRKLTLRQKNAIKEEATKNRLYASQIVAKLQLPVGKRRVQQILSADQTVKWKKATKKNPN